MFYLFGWLLTYALYFSQGRKLVSRVAPYALVLICLTSIAFFRADIGTDTYIYEKIFGDVAEGAENVPVEPGFVLIAHALNTFILDPYFAVRSLSILIALLCFATFLLSNYSLRLFIFVYLTPAFFYSYSMNVLRLGLATSIFLISISLFAKHKTWIPLALLLYSFTVHSSLLAVAIYLSPFVFTIRLKFYILAVAALFAILVLLNWQAIFQYVSINLLFKLDLYASDSGTGRPNSGGLSLVISSMILLVGIALSNLPISHKVPSLTMGLAGVFSSFVLAQYSYAGIRFLGIMAISIPLSSLCYLSRTPFPVDRSILRSYLVSALWLSLTFFYSMLNESRVSDFYPWLPYDSWL